MMRMMEIVETQVLRRLEQTRMIALAELEDADEAETAGAALLAAGCSCLEIQSARIGVLRGARRVEGLLVGAGNLRSAEEADAAVRAGAHFATASATNIEVVHACRELELPFFPGVATPTEIERLAILGVRVVRVFPALALGGPAYLAAIAATYPDMRFIPSGGIGPELLREYLRIPSVVAVGVSGLIRKDLLRSHSFGRIEWLAGEAMRAAGSR
jgi:2-dehydro-3-deoxyphosphogluconate aldolase / (4S)-4-hydroxy-2-oxoglutarate aldolase